MAPSVVHDEPWFVQAFDRIYLHVYPHRDDAEAESNASWILSQLGAGAGQTLLDVACGAGRYSRAFSRRGLRVTGVDLSAELLEEGRERSPSLPGAPTYIRWDIRNLPFHGQFDGAVSLFTSFGYFDSRADDVRIMAGVCRALRPGRRFLVDYLNAARVRMDLEAESEVSTGGLRVRMQRTIDEDGPTGPRVVKHVEAVRADTGLTVAAFDEQVRLYTADEVDELLEEGGLELVGERIGDFGGRPFDDQAPRLIRVCRRPN